MTVLNYKRYLGSGKKKCILDIKFLIYIFNKENQLPELMH